MLNFALWDSAILTCNDLCIYFTLQIQAYALDLFVVEIVKHLNHLLLSEKKNNNKK